MFVRLTAFFTRLVDTTLLPDRPLPNRAWPFVWQIGWRLRFIILPLLVMNIVLGVLSGITPYLWKRIVDPLSGPLQSTALADALTGPVTVYVGLALVFAFILRNVKLTLQMSTINASISHMVIRQLYHYQLGQSIALFHDEMSGRLASKVNAIGSRTSSLLQTLLENVFITPVTVVTSLVTLLFVSPWLAVPLTIWAVLFLGSNAMLLPPLTQLTQQSADAGNTTFGRMIDTLSNMTLVKLFAHSGVEDARIVEVIGNERRLDLKAHLGWSSYYALNEFFDMVLTIATLILVLALRVRGLITTGDVIMAVTLVSTASTSIAGLMRNVSSVLGDTAVLDENLSVTTRPYAVRDATNAVVLPRVRGEIRLEQLAFRYGPDLPIVLHDLSMTIPAGQKVGLIGSSGAGKSTLMQLLLRLYEPTGGRILFDGQDIAIVTQESLRRQIAIVTQDTALMNRSVADNIRYGRPDASDAEVQDAAVAAQAHEFIELLREAAHEPYAPARKGVLGRFSQRIRRGKPPSLQPRLGYDAHVGERGIKLSGGQRQRIAIARLILKDAPILILDEATSALDSEVEAAIQENLVKVMAGRTVIAIAHRLSTIAQLDRLIVLDGGRIVEDGTHAVLLKNQGLYARLWHRQSGGFLAVDDAGE